MDGVTDVKWDHSVFKNLVIEEKAKALLFSFITSRLAEDQVVDFDDFITGKGKGLIILLHGPPGIGKTMTAEAGK